MSKKDKKYKPTKTWFFVRKSDDTLVFEESKNQAWERHKDPNYENFGTSDGTTYKKMVRENKKEIKKLSKKAEKARQRVEKMYDNKEKLLTEDFLDEDDPKVQRAEKKIEEQEQRIDEILNELQEKQSSVVKRAQKAEAAQANKNGYTRPPNQDVKTPYESGKKRDIVVNELSEYGTKSDMDKEDIKQLLQQDDVKEILKEIA